MFKEPTVGMIVPQAEGAVPPEAYGLYPKGVRFVACGLGLSKLTIEGYSGVIESVPLLARKLVEQGADAIALMGTSLSFFRGSAFNEELIQLLQKTTNVPVTTMSSAIRDALKAVGARRIAVGTAYTDEVNQRLASFLADSGFEIAALESLGMVEIDEVLSVQEEMVSELVIRAMQNASGSVDAVLIACGGLPALNLATEIEERVGVPVVASATAGVWASVRMVGMSGIAPELGRLGKSESTESPLHPSVCCSRRAGD